MTRGKVRRVLPAAAKQAAGPFVFFDHSGPIEQPADANQDVRRIRTLAWPPYTQNIEGLLKTLVVLGTRDPVTAHAGGISLAKTLGASRLTIAGEHHDVALIGGNACANDIAADH